MRFAYIDSQGKEVGIPSVEALQLRIELGAIVESTMFYDANADHWAAAGEHDIFRTLQRELAGDEEGFVAPLPPTFEEPETVETPDASASAAEPSEAPESPVADAPVQDDEPPVVAAESGHEVIEEESLEVEDEPVEAASVEAPATEAPEADAGADAAAEQDGEELPDFTFDFTAEGKEEEEEEDQIPLPSEEDDAPFDFGDFDSLELEETEDDEEEEEEAPDLGGGMELETPLDEQDFGTGAGADDEALELERPMSEYTPDTPPGWMDEQDEEEEEAVPEPAAASEPAEDEPRRGGGSDSYLQLQAAGEEKDKEKEERKAPRRAPPPRRAKKSIPVGLVAGIVVVLGAAGGGWFFLTRGGGEAETPVEVPRAYPEVVIPEIAPELEGTYRQLASLTFSDFLAEIGRAKEEVGLPDEPHDQWLAGRYLANASDFEGVREFWTALGDYLTRLRAEEEEMFVSAFRARMEEAGVAESDRESLAARARAGFQASLPDRDPAYDTMNDVIEASLELHRFLLENESNIDYEPASGGGSRDPVLEAVPLTSELGDEMWDKVADITDALEDMGALRSRVTTDRLVSLLVAKLGSAPPA